MAEADSRRLNGMDAATKAIHIRLERWGNWSRVGHPRAWADESLTYRIMKEGPHGAQSSGPPPITMPPDIELTEAAVNRLPPLERVVILKCYTEWAPDEVMARQLRISVNVLKKARKRGREHVAVFIHGVVFACAPKAA